MILKPLNIIAFALSLFVFSVAQASDDSVGLLADSNWQPSLLSETPASEALVIAAHKHHPILLAQASDSSDPYDPFADYSEFDEATDEEADINFFKNGRFFTLGFTVGNRMMTDQLREVYTDSVNFGVFLCYFFDLRFAMQLSFSSGADHNITIKTLSTNTEYRGSSSISSMNLSLKYYFNTQNVTRGLAQFNPYLIGGLVQVTRKISLENFAAEGPSEDGATGFEIGAGIEVPMLRKKMFLGLQASYQMVTFSDENKEILPENNEPTGIRPAGDLISAKAILGINF